MKKQKAVCRTVAVVEAKHIKPEVMPPLGDIEEPNYNTPGERINYHVGMAQHHGRKALAHLIIAGWELSKQKQAIGYGGWVEWCDKNLQISRITADRYIQFFTRTVGAMRTAAEIPISKKPTVTELSAATVGMEDKSATRAMIDLGIVKRIKNEDGNSWGGPGRNQGRKPKGKEGGVEAAEEMVELDKVAETHSGAWSIVREHLRSLQDAQREHHVFDRLEVVELAEAHSILKALCKDVEAALQRFDNI